MIARKRTRTNTRTSEQSEYVFVQRDTAKVTHGPVSSTHLDVYKRQAILVIVSCVARVIHALGGADGCSETLSDL